MQRASAYLLGLLPVLCFSSVGLAAERLALLYILHDETPSEQVIGAQQALWRPLGKICRALLSPHETLQALRNHPTLRTSRQKAAKKTARAAALIQQMKYPRALEQLERAKAEANAGLAQLLQPRLLSEIHFLQGIAHLPNKSPVAQEELLLSFSFWPTREINKEQYPPRIINLLQQSAKKARATPLPPPPPALGARAAAVLKVKRLLVAWPRTSRGQVKLQLWLYDARQQAWIWSAEETWAQETPLALVEDQITARLKSYFLPPSPVAPAAPTRGWMIWLGAGISGATLVCGTVFSLLAQNKATEIEALAGQSPPVEFDPVGGDLEDAGTRWRTAAIISFSLAGAAAITTTLLALWPSESEVDQRPTISVGPGSVRLLLTFP